MVTGRRMQNLQKDPLLHESNNNRSRNLNKHQLGGVIFGCKNSTFQECISQQLFGLPAQHIAYVQCIEEGLPLFLFNYSDRTLHGIFEAASSGKLNINPYAWTDGSTKTPFPSQVQVRLRIRCKALTEDQFKPIIQDNYYTHSHFYFELDHAQASKLTSMLSSVAIASRAYPPVQWAPLNRTREENTHDLVKSREAEENEIDLLYLKLNEMAIKAAIAKQEELDMTAGINDDVANFENGNASDDVLTLPDDNNSQLIINQLIDEVAELNAFKMENTQKVYFLEQKLEKAYQEINWLKNRVTKLESLSNNQETEESPIGMVEELKEESEVKIDESILLIGGYDGENWLSNLDLYSPFSDKVKTLKPMSNIRSYGSVAKLNGEIFAFGGGNGSIWYDTVESYNPVENKWSSRPSMNTKRLSLAGTTLNDKIFALGGGNGIDCFSSVEFFDPYADRWISTQSMFHKRFALASTLSNASIFAVGGFDGLNYLKSAERFDPREHKWSKIESMSVSRGCHSLIVMNEKLYAIGGYDGNGMVESVEIYDVRMNKWSMGESMEQPRGYLCGGVLNDTLFVIGGVKSGVEIVETVEYYKQGQGWKTSDDLKAVGRRCFGSSIVFD